MAERGDSPLKFRDINSEVASYLTSHPERHSFQKFLDAPCGDGRFVRLAKEHFPQGLVRGADIIRFPSMEESLWRKVDATRPFALADAPFDVVTSICGVMDFDNTANFLEMCAKHLRPGGLLIVTNDNVLSLRDRLSFLFFGRFKRFASFFRPGDPTFKAILIQELHKLVLEQGLEIQLVRYCCVRAEDWLLLPFALPLFLVQALHHLLAKHPIPLRERFQLVPLQALTHRHYFFVCRKHK